jgi:hypothetical protein
MYDDQTIFGDWPLSRLVGLLLVMLGMATFLWVLWEVYRLFSQAGSFARFDALIPEQIVVADLARDGMIYLPRELLVYGIPLWILGLATNIGGSFFKWGFQNLNPKPPDKTSS